MMGEVEGLIRLFGVLAMLQLKSWSARGVSHQPAFVGNCYLHVFSLMHPLNFVKHQQRSSYAKLCAALLDDWANGGYVDGLPHAW